MTKKVTQNVTNSNSEDLTEQLHQGKLPDNHHYYFQMPNGKYEVGNTFCLETLRWCKGGDKIKVLEEVPSYDELQNQAFILKSRESEIVKLKELLKEIRQQITRQVFGSPKVQLFEGTFDNELLDKIEQALGEE